MIICNLASVFVLCLLVRGNWSQGQGPAHQGSERHGSERHGFEQHGSQQYPSDAQHGSEQHGSDHHGAQQHGSQQYPSDAQHGGARHYQPSHYPYCPPKKVQYKHYHDYGYSYPGWYRHGYTYKKVCSKVHHGGYINYGTCYAYNYGGYQYGGYHHYYPTTYCYSKYCLAHVYYGKSKCHGYVKLSKPYEYRKAKECSGYQRSCGGSSGLGIFHFGYNRCSCQTKTCTAKVLACYKHGYYYYEDKVEIKYPCGCVCYKNKSYYPQPYYGLTNFGFGF